MKTLFGLPEILQATLLTEWLSFKEVGLLDSAVCNVKLRPEYLRLLKADYCIFSDANYCSINAEWAINRAIKLRQVRLPDTNRKLRKELLKHLSKSSIESIIVDSSTYKACGTTAIIEGQAAKLILADDLEHILRDICKFCPHIKRFELGFRRISSCTFSDANFCAFCSLVSQCTQLESLTLISIFNLPVMFLAALLTAPSLVHLHLDQCTLAKEVRNETTLEAYRNIKVESFHCDCSTVWLAQSFPLLKTFSMEGIYVRFATFLVPVSCPHVTSVTLDYIPNKSNRALTEDLSQMQQWCLTSLCVKVKGQVVCLPEVSVLPFVKNCKYLATISSMSNYSTTYSVHYKGSRLTQLSMCCDDAASLATIVAECPYLYALYLEQGDEKSPVTYTPVEQSLDLIVGTNIKVLSLCRYTSLRNDDLLQLQYANLTIFKLCKCGEQITNDGILQLVSSMPNLHTIVIEHCATVTHKVVLQLPPLCPNLRSFTYNCVDSSRKSKPSELVTDMLSLLYPHVVYWHVLC